MTTTALLTLNKQCKKTCEEIYVMSNTWVRSIALFFSFLARNIIVKTAICRLLNILLEDIRQHVGCLFQLSADVAELDLILSLVQISCNPEYVRPSFGTKLELINSLHPIMELFNRDLPISNDVVSVNHDIMSNHNKTSMKHRKFIMLSYFIPQRTERLVRK